MWILLWRQYIHNEMYNEQLAEAREVTLFPAITLVSKPVVVGGMLRGLAIGVITPVEHLRIRCPVTLVRLSS
jgi:hypothetical protein